MLSGCGGGLRRSRPVVCAKALARHGRGGRRRGAGLRCVGPMWPRALACGARRVPDTLSYHNTCTCCTLGTSVMLLIGQILDTIDIRVRRNKMAHVPSVQLVHVSSYFFGVGRFIDALFFGRVVRGSARERRGLPTGGSLPVPSVANGCRTGAGQTDVGNRIL